jgi:hypothetical protein
MGVEAPGFGVAVDAGAGGQVCDSPGFTRE